METLQSASNYTKGAYYNSTGRYAGLSVVFRPIRATDIIKDKKLTIHITAGGCAGSTQKIYVCTYYPGDGSGGWFLVLAEDDGFKWPNNDFGQNKVSPTTYSKTYDVTGFNVYDWVFVGVQFYNGYNTSTIWLRVTEATFTVV